MGGGRREGGAGAVSRCEQFYLEVCLHDLVWREGCMILSWSFLFFPSSGLSVLETEAQNHILKY